MDTMNVQSNGMEEHLELINGLEQIHFRKVILVKESLSKKWN